jgi:hypothetical protein
MKLSHRLRPAAKLVSSAPIFCFKMGNIMENNKKMENL